MDKKQVNKKAGGAAAAGTSVERKPRSVSKDSASGRAGKSSAQKIKAGGAGAGAKAGKMSAASKSKSPAGKNRSASKGKQGTSAKKGAGKGGKTSRSKSSGKEESKGGKKGDKKNKKSSESEEDKKEDVKEERKPPKVIGTYIYFNTATTKRLKEEEGLSHKEAFAKAGQLWQTATEEEKKPFEELHQEDIKRYDAQMKMLKEKGYFMIDGVKSTDLEDKSAKKKKAKSGEDSKSAGKKRASGASVGKSKAAGKAAGKAAEPKKGAAAAASGKKQSKKSEDDLDIEDDESEALEQSD